jgi:hypothetical protein
MGAVLWAGCLDTPSTPVDLKYRASYGDSLSYETKTVVSGQNATDISTLTTNVVKLEGDRIIRDIIIRSSSINGTPTDTMIRYDTDLRGIPDTLPPEQQLLMNLAMLPNTLVYPDHPVRPGDTWHYSPAFNGTMNTRGIPVEYRYTAQDTFTFTGNGTCTVAAGTPDCNRILHTGTSRLTFTMSLENKTIITTIDRTYSGENTVAADKGYLVTSEYKSDATTIFDTSAMTGDPLGLSMTGTTSHSRSSTVLQRG